MMLIAQLLGGANSLAERDTVSGTWIKVPAGDGDWGGSRQKEGPGPPSSVNLYEYLTW